MQFQTPSCYMAKKNMLNDFICVAEATTLSISPITFYKVIVFG
jgi:hypothetical protein